MWIQNFREPSWQKLKIFLVATIKGQWVGGWRKKRMNQWRSQRANSSLFYLFSALNAFMTCSCIPAKREGRTTSRRIFRVAVTRHLYNSLYLYSSTIQGSSVIQIVFCIAITLKQPLFAFQHNWRVLSYPRLCEPYFLLTYFQIIFIIILFIYLFI